MPKITYIEPSGAERTVEVEVGMSVMEGAINNMVDGITADCGGACSCATCHVHVDEKWFGKTGGPGDAEADLIEFAEQPSQTSRLGCQINITEELDGLLVRIEG